MNQQIIIVNGFPRSGKDSFCSFCKDFLNSLGIKVDIVSSVDKVKEAALLLGWDGKKDEKGRKFLSDLKDLSTLVYNGPFNYITEHIFSTEAIVVFIFIREASEITKVVASHKNVFTLKVSRPSGEEHYINTGDADVENYQYDFVIYNTKTLEHLQHLAQIFCKNHILKKERETNKDLDRFLNSL